MIDRILLRLPEWDYFFPAASFVQNYISQQYWQIAQKIKFVQPKFVIEVWDESHLFFTSMFPRLEVTVREREEINREDWDCVVDMRDISRAFRVAWPTSKHIVDAWGAMFGANPQRLPVLGPMAITCKEPHYDFLIDEGIEGSLEIAKVLLQEGSGDVRTFPMSAVRAYKQFRLLADAKVFVGRRSAATYLAATMGKGLIETWPVDMPLWFMSKPQSEGYRLVIEDKLGRADKDVLIAHAKSFIPKLSKVA